MAWRGLPSLLEGRQGVLAVDSVHFQILILLQEVFDGHEAAADPYQELAIDTLLHVNTLGPVSVHSFAFADEKHVQLVSILVFIQILGELLINLIILLGNVNDLRLLELVIELHQLANFGGGRLDLYLLLF